MADDNIFAKYRFAKLLGFPDAKYKHHLAPGEAELVMQNGNEKIFFPHAAGRMEAERQEYHVWDSEDVFQTEPEYRFTFRGGTCNSQCDWDKDSLPSWDEIFEKVCQLKRDNEYRDDDYDI